MTAVFQTVPSADRDAVWAIDGNHGSNWRKVIEGEFSNIRNNPAAWHTVEFAPVKARYVRLRAKANSIMTMWRDIRNLIS